MVAEAAAAAIPAGDVVKRPSSSKKNQGKVRKKIHKAEREKQKRGHMNILFLDLSKAVEPAHQSNGKASMLNDTIRLVKELLTQVDCLKKENAALLSESHYVNVEKNELSEENSALEAEIEKLQSQVDSRTHSRNSMSLNISQSQIDAAAPQPPEDHFSLPSIDYAAPSASVVGPVFILPLHHDPQVYPQSDTAEVFQSNLSKPRPRYPSTSDSWPSHILDGQLNRNENDQQSGGSLSSGSIGGS